MGILADWLYDWKLERRIATVRDRCSRLSAEQRYAEARDEFASLRLLIAQRRPEQVARLEQERGLR